VLSGLQEGDQVALLGAALIQAQRNAQSDRIRSMTGNGLPGTGSTAGGARGGRNAAVNTPSSGGSRSGSSGGTSGSSGSSSGGGSAPPPPPSR
jgi:hypothetical protein